MFVPIWTQHTWNIPGYYVTELPDAPTSGGTDTTYLTKAKITIQTGQEFTLDLSSQPTGNFTDNTTQVSPGYYLVYVPGLPGEVDIYILVADGDGGKWNTTYAPEGTPAYYWFVTGPIQSAFLYYSLTLQTDTQQVLYNQVQAVGNGQSDLKIFANNEIWPKIPFT